VLETNGDAAMGEFIDRWLSGPLFAHLSPEQADRSARLSNTAAGLASSLRTTGTGTQTPLWDRLGELEMPVLVVVGANDAKFGPIAERTARTIGENARLAVIANAGHAACFEQPGAFVSLLRDFLAERR
jgi:2-succinyl-6-hydroxy-2,4-cyclohexadiene-1-carboxylate synthase